MLPNILIVHNKISSIRLLIHCSGSTTESVSHCANENRICRKLISVEIVFFDVHRLVIGIIRISS